MRRYIEYAIIAAVLFLVGKAVWNFWHDDKQSDAAIVMAERVRADSVKRKEDSVALERTREQLGLALANGVKVVERWRTSAPLPIQAGTPHDSIVQLTKQVKGCRELGDTLAKSVVNIQTACGAFRDTATRTIANLKTSYARLDSLLKIGKPPKRWGIGPYAGYGYNHQKSGGSERGLSGGIAVSYHIFSW